MYGYLLFGVCYGGDDVETEEGVGKRESLSGRGLFDNCCTVTLKEYQVFELCLLLHILLLICNFNAEALTKENAI